MWKKRVKIMSVAILLIAGGCYPEGAEYVEEMDVVFTDYDPEFNFTDQSTYAIPDSIVLIDEQNFNSSNGNQPDVVDPEYANVILDEINANMEAMGWTEVDKEDNPDVILLVSATRTTNLFYNYDYSYWDWWYPGSYYGSGYGGGMGWYYPRYSPGGYISGYRSGTLMIQMANASELGANNNVSVVWLGVINGLLEGSTTNINNRLVQTINQAFHQSQYLNI